MIDPYTEIHFSGGEPMMQEDHYQFLELLIKLNKTDVKIRYNTNLTTYKLKNYHAFELLQKFDNVFMVGSIDAMGIQGEYIRKGFSWEGALDWIKTCKEYLPNIDYGISSVFQVLNASAAVDLHRYMCEDDLFRRKDGSNFGFYLNTLHEPRWLRASILPPDYKKEVTDKINAHIDWLEQTQVKDFHFYKFVEHWTSAINMMNSVDQTHIIPHFYKKTLELDNIRDESFEEIFPELHARMKIYDR